MNPTFGLRVIGVEKEGKNLSISSLIFARVTARRTFPDGFFFLVVK